MTANPISEKVKRCTEALKELLGDTPVPSTALVLGSGLGLLADAMDIKRAIPYSEIEGFPISTAPGHDGRFLFGTLAGTPLVMMQGRIHYYEGYAMTDVVLPARVLASLGVKALVLTNASGGINESFTPGDLMLITDHITSFVPSPLIGPNPDEIGLRFPDMTQVYDREFQAALRQASAETGIPLQEGVYLQLTGPHFETPTEIKMYRALGGDAVGMSTAVEAIAARHAGVRVAGISCISNYGAGMPGQGTLTSEEVDEIGRQVAEHFGRLLTIGLAKISTLVEVQA